MPSRHLVEPLCPLLPKVPTSKVKDVHLPAQPTEIWRKLLPLALVFFCATFNLTILANLKDAIMVTTAGAETLPFLASFGVLPASVGCVGGHLRCCHDKLEPHAFIWHRVAQL